MIWDISTAMAWIGASLAGLLPRILMSLASTSSVVGFFGDNGMAVIEQLSNTIRKKFVTFSIVVCLGLLQR